MNGYLLREQAYTAGEAIFIDCVNDINKFAVAFEDDTDTGYFYAYALDGEGKQLILDALHIYNIEEVPAEQRKGIIRIIWSKDWQCCALVINNYCHAIFDFKNHGGYCRNEFPEPNPFWTKGNRTLTNEMVAALFK
ncbi:hypothetical protein A4H97_01775 [Niastella yeongjuensis]|uniref:DUF2251 domain-containing protein n=1 Tax=Niastella yeongjuensis TaxID=354355 RepID=A0A1V9EXG4_9BACT|nr:DUF2251 domain-containing protein [Niastella yeongjuensis]OQP50594.1 hypothetical protein A4H97_01775 [Niastella yeongjuensis]SEN27032.1 hypothetical protein SAMN05660816_00590 [Niastella yeongjuensis]